MVSTFGVADHPWVEVGGRKVKDPNQIIQRVKILAGMASRALSEAQVIIENAKEDKEDPEVIKLAEQILEEV